MPCAPLTLTSLRQGTATPCQRGSRASAAIQCRAVPSRNPSAQAAAVALPMPSEANPTTIPAGDDERMGPAGPSPAAQLEAAQQAALFSLSLPKNFRIPFGFTKRNELMFGRLALFGVAAALTGELTTGLGPVTQLGFQTGVSSIWELDHTLLAAVGFNLAAALLPARGRFVPDERTLRERPMVLLINPKKYLGDHDSMVTKESEVALGRMAQLGLAASLMIEAVTGKGVLAHCEIETGLPLCETDPLVLLFLTFTLLAAISPGSGKFVDDKWGKRGLKKRNRSA